MLPRPGRRRVRILQLDGYHGIASISSRLDPVRWGDVDPELGWGGARRAETGRGRVEPRRAGRDVRDSRGYRREDVRQKVVLAGPDYDGGVHRRDVSPGAGELDGDADGGHRRR